MAKNKKDPVLQAIIEKRHSILVSGNNVFDNQIEMEYPFPDEYASADTKRKGEIDERKSKIFYRPTYVANHLFEQGYYVLRFSQNSGFTIFKENKLQDRSELDSLLGKHNMKNLIGLPGTDPEKVANVFCGFKKLAYEKSKRSFVFIIDYTPHIVSKESATVVDEIIAETINELTFSPQVKANGHLVVAYAHEDGNLSSLLKGMTKITYNYPTPEEYEHFINIIVSRTNEYADCEVDTGELAKICRGLTLNQIATLFRAAKENGETVSREEILKEKEKLIDQISEGTLKVLPTNLSFDDLAGLEVPKKVMIEFAEKLKDNSAASPRAILLTGPPGTGKSTIVSAFAKECGWNCVELSDAIKSKWVGESEARLKLALDLIVALSPVILMIDEIDQTFQSRSAVANDGGVTQHYLKTLFKFAADDSLRGKVCIVGCSNAPQLLDEAMSDRFRVTIPLLAPTANDIANIFPKIEERITGKTATLKSEEKKVKEASDFLFSKGVSPRQIYDVITRTIIRFGDNFSAENILETSKTFRGNSDADSTAFSSLSAIKWTMCSDYFPWAIDKDKGKYPAYLHDVVDWSTGDIIEAELHKKLNDLKGRARF
jgi:AAA+ superfamily predicted ATPase